MILRYCAKSAKASYTLECKEGAGFQKKLGAFLLQKQQNILQDISVMNQSINLTTELKKKI